MQSNVVTVLKAIVIKRLGELVVEYATSLLIRNFFHFTEDLFGWIKVRAIGGVKTV